MSANNLQAFFQKVTEDRALQDKVAEIDAKFFYLKAEELSKLSQEAGTPVTTDQILAAVREDASQLTDDDLDKVSGGLRFLYFDVNMSCVPKFILALNRLG